MFNHLTNPKAKEVLNVTRSLGLSCSTALLESCFDSAVLEFAILVEEWVAVSFDKGREELVEDFPLSPFLAVELIFIRTKLPLV